MPVHRPRRKTQQSRSPSSPLLAFPPQFGARLRAPALVLYALFVSVPVAAHTKSIEPAVILAPGYAALEYAAPVAGSYRLPALGPAADAPYVDSRGNQGRLHQLFDGHVTVLSFIYTQCDDVNGCPLASYVMGQIARLLASNSQIMAKLRLVSFSFDIDFDTPDVLEQYAKSFRPPGTDWAFISAPKRSDLDATLASYQQSVLQSDGHSFAHILRVFLVDSSKRIRNIYSTSFLHADTLASDIQTILLEQGDISPAAITSEQAAAVAASTLPSTIDPGLGLPANDAYHGPRPSAAMIALGKRLFFDRRLSLNRTISCAMCHVPAQGFTVNELATAVGIEGRTVKRNAPTLLNVGYLQRLFHDGRENRLDQQIWSPLLAANEMGNPAVGYVIDNLKRWDGYAEQFQTALGRAISMESIGLALAAYQRSLVAAGSAFDRYYYGRDKNALTATERAGLALFQGKAQCASCHLIGQDHALFTDEALHNTGVGYRASMGTGAGLRTARFAGDAEIEYDLASVAPSAEPKPNDLGRYEITQDPADRWKFRTPSLRNVALTKPYMHDGSLSTLDEVVAFYDQGGIAHDLLDPRLRPLALSPAERDQLVAFLHSLTSPAVADIVKRIADDAITNPQQRSQP